ncbi:hypothetical protein [Pseudomonas fluorescens]|uniref:hypothetical protein n=1 Tax=Pseudomonas fluorescens TaxID=294 RepID=UPI0017858854|nr:hypothetical protein [Pseudomonas fluorescens]
MASLKDLVEAGEPLLQVALLAMRRYYEAEEAKAPAEEVNRLRLEAEALFKQVSEYQLRSLHSVMHTLH